MTKADLQLFQASICAIERNLKPLYESIPQKVFDELDAMKLVIERNMQNEH